MARYYKKHREYLENTKYTAVGQPTADLEGEHPYASITTSTNPPREYANFDWRNTAEPSKATELFTHYQGSTTVETAFSDQTMRHHIPTLVGLAAVHNPGTDLVVGSDLSKYSSRLVKHAVDKGLIYVDSNADDLDGGQTNDITMDRRSLHPNFVSRMDHAASIEGDTRIVPPHHILQAKQFVRQALGRGEPAVKPPVIYPQDSLPGITP